MLITQSLFKEETQKMNHFYKLTLTSNCDHNNLVPRLLRILVLDRFTIIIEKQICLIITIDELNYKYCFQYNNK